VGCRPMPMDGIGLFIISHSFRNLNLHSTPPECRVHGSALLGFRVGVFDILCCFSFPHVCVPVCVASVSSSISLSTVQETLGRESQIPEMCHRVNKN